MVKVTEIEPGILHASFGTQYDMAMAFCRMSEWAECPDEEFNHKLFALEDYMRWYAQVYGKGVFTYTKDWGGFNVTEESVGALDQMARLDGRYTLSSHEYGLLLAIEPFRRPTFSLIGTSAGKDEVAFVAHELAHARWHVDDDYRGKMVNIVHKYDTEPLRMWLVVNGYHERVHDDEVHAYALTGWPRKFKLTPDLKALSRELKRAH